MLRRLLVLGLLPLTVACASGKGARLKSGVKVVDSGTGPAAAAPTPAKAETPPPSPAQKPPQQTPVPPPELSELPPEAEDEPAPDLAAGDPDALVAEALEAYESADDFWQEGSFDDAFAALDRAYELMSGIETNGDPLIAQQKEDLRRLISHRIVEVYASRSTVVVGTAESSIPVPINDHVEREIKSFQNAEREQFLAGYERSGQYRPMILEELRRAGMPEELSWLPMVESWFKVRALSRARALGMWQFIASTGYRFGLQRNEWFDERMDPVKSTRAALAYLGELHELFGDWTTALASYNCGEVRVHRVIEGQRISYFDQFWDLYEQLPGETRRYVPRFLATLAILQDPAKYGFTDLPEPLPPVDWETVETDRPARLEDLDRALGLESGTLAALNPELRRGATPNEPYELKVPAGQGRPVADKLASLPKYSPPAVTTSIHRVRPGETLSGIAQHYGTSVSTLMRLNSLRNPHRISPGQQLRVTGRGPAVTTYSGGPTTYVVRRGDSLWSIAQHFGTTVDRIKRGNDLRGNTLRPGQRLVIGAGSVAGGTYVVRSGDTLSSIASASRVPVTRLAAANGLTLRSTIYPGQRLVIPD